MSKVITEYKIVKDNKSVDDDSSFKSVEPVIKIPVIERVEKKIVARDMTPKLEEPKLQLTRNTEGVVVGIEVQCTCGEKILIRLDYKL
jgi:hypothetical protein